MNTNELPDTVRRSLAFIIAWGLAFVALFFVGRDETLVALTIAIVIEGLKVAYWIVNP